MFRVNVGWGGRSSRSAYGSVNYAAFDVLLPHPTYAKQGWVSIVNPGPASGELLRSLLVEAYERAKSRYR